MKRILKSSLSLAVAFAITVAACLGAAVGSDIKAQAYRWSGTIEQDVAKRDVWTSEGYWDANVFYVSPEESGFYKFTFTDHRQTGHICAELYGTGDFHTPYSYDASAVTSVYTSEAVYLAGNKSYQLQVTYYNPTNINAAVSADITVEYEAATYEPSTLSSGALSSSSTVFNFTDDREYYSFTTTSAGDYTLNFSQMGAYVNVYNATKGTDAELWRDTEYFKYGEGDVSRVGLVFKLEANTEYYFLFVNYKETGSTRLSITKNAKELDFISVYSANRTFGSLDSELQLGYELNYKLTYLDSTHDIMSANELQNAGYILPDLEYGGKTNEVNVLEMLVAGKYPIYADYQGVISSIFIEVKSYSDYLVEQGDYPTGEYINYYVYNSGDPSVMRFDFVRIKVADTGVYGLDTTWSNWSDLDYFSPVMIDSRNNIVEYNEELKGWPLVGYDEYTLSIFYSYAPGVYSEFTFYPVRRTEVIYPDASSKAWYSDPITYVSGAGIMKGYGNGYFGTADGIQRQDFLVMLARFDGVDLTEYEDLGGRFSDVGAGGYYETAVNWGSDKKITTGYQDGRFGVGDMITREQLVTFLYRYAEYKGYDVSVTPSARLKAMQYPDFAQVSPFAQDAVIWAIDRGVISGKSGYIAPQGLAQRCEIAQIMYNIFKKKIL